MSLESWVNLIEDLLMAAYAIPNELGVRDMIPSKEVLKGLI